MAKEKTKEQDTAGQQAVMPLIEAMDAEIISKKLHEAITDFDAGINEDEEVALKLISFDGESTLAVDGVGAIGRALIRFTGKYNGRSATIIQSTPQVNFLLYSKPRDVEKPRRVIGFLDPINNAIDKMEADLQKVDLEKITQ